MKTVSNITLVSAILMLVLSGCASAAGDDWEDGVDWDEASGEEEVGSSTEALANQQGAGTGNWCTSCGCTLKPLGKDEAGCRLYTCVCSTEEQAKCASGKQKRLVHGSLTEAVEASGALSP